MKHLKLYETYLILPPSGGFGTIISYHKLEIIEPTLRGLIRDNIEFDFYYNKSDDSNIITYLILLKRDEIPYGILPSIDQDHLYGYEITNYDIEDLDWIKVDDVETFLDAKKYNL